MVALDLLNMTTSNLHMPRIKEAAVGSQDSLSGRCIPVGDGPPPHCRGRQRLSPMCRRDIADYLVLH
jgi:hypothetical protein